MTSPIRALEITFYNCVTFFIKDKNIPWQNIKESTFNYVFFYNKITHFYIRLSLLLSTQLFIRSTAMCMNQKLYSDLILALIPILLKYVNAVGGKKKLKKQTNKKIHLSNEE